MIVYLRLRFHIDLMYEAAEWFSSKWGISDEVYKESMYQTAIDKDAAIPQWYIAWKDGDINGKNYLGGKIVGGLGVIENDFHDRPDLTPNVCAVYVEPEYRGQGIAGELLSFACRDMKLKGIDTLYLVTDHVGFYERYGWEYYCEVTGSDGNKTRMYRRDI